MLQITTGVTTSGVRRSCGTEMYPKWWLILIASPFSSARVTAESVDFVSGL